MARSGSAEADSTQDEQPRLVNAMRLASRFVWEAARPQFLASLAGEVVGAVALAGILLFGRDIVTALTDGSVEGLGDALLPTLGLGLSMVVSGLATVFVRQGRYLVAEHVTRRVEEEIVDVSTSVDFQQFEDQSFHDALNRSNTRASESSYQLVYNLLGLVNVLATSLVVTYVLVTSVPQVLGALLLIAAPAIIAARASARLGYQAAYELTPNDRLRYSLYRALVERANARELRVFGLAGVLRRRWGRLYDDRMTRVRQVVRRQTFFNGLAALIGAALVAAVLLVLVQAAIVGQISLGDAAIAIVALQQLSTRLRGAANSSGALREATLFLHDFQTFRRLRRDTTPDVGSSTVLPRGSLVVDRVCFRYPGTDRPVLDDVSLKIGPGEIVALVGVSGSGKTTLAHLVTGLYRPTSGTISYGGVDVADIPRSDYWRSLAVVFQDFVRYELTARENVAVSDHERMTDLSAIEAAARRAGIADVLAALPKGYETMMSRAFEDGAELSVGQWQRVAVARAFFREAPLLILDEPAAALDARAEQQLYERLVELCETRSVLLVSHRFSTVRLADRICVVAQGRIVEQGTHQELMALEGQYAELFSIQARGYLDPVSQDPQSR